MTMTVDPTRLSNTPSLLMLFNFSFKKIEERTALQQEGRRKLKHFLPDAYANGGS